VILRSPNAIAVTSSARHHQPSYDLPSAKHLSRTDVGSGLAVAARCRAPDPVALYVTR
jgi:hypothetical protein